MLKIKFYFIFGLLSCFLFSCTKASVEEDPIVPINNIVKYNPEVKNIMTINCTSCHGGNNPIAGINLENYEDVRFYTENENLLNRINDAASPMPPSGLLPINEILLIEKWMEDGFLEN